MSTINDVQVGPGSYNISSNFKLRSQVYENSPRPVFGKGKKFPDVFISDSHIREKLLTNSPPVNTYNPNVDYLYSTCKIYSFGTEKRKDNFTKTYYYEKGKNHDLKVSNSGKTLKNFRKVEENRREMNKTSANSKNLRKFSGASSEYTQYWGKTQGGDPRKLFHSNVYVEKDNVPGPGSYLDIFESDKKKKKIMFNKSNRHLDIRTCKEYLDRNAVDYLHINY